MKYYEYIVNKGKGVVLYIGIVKVIGEYLIIQDVDLEYDFVEYNDLLKFIFMGVVDVVYGLRFMGLNLY